MGVPEDQDSINNKSLTFVSMEEGNAKETVYNNLFQVRKIVENKTRKGLN